MADRSQDVDLAAAYSPPTDNSGGVPVERSEEAALGRSGAHALLAVTIIEALATTISYFLISPVQPHWIELTISYGIVGIFAGLYVWARSNPYPACITGLSLYLVLHALAAVADPSSIFRGIIMKVIVISVLGKAIADIRRWRLTTGA